MYDIVSVGTIARDLFLKSHLFKTLKDPEHLKRLGFPTGEAECFALGSKVDITEIHDCLGGGGANSAVTFARQELKTAALLKIGRHLDSGLHLLSELKHEGIKVLPAFAKKHATSQSVILLAPTGERTILNYRGASEELKASDLPKNLKASWAYIVPGKIAFSEIIKISKRLHAEGTKLAINPSRQYLELGLHKLSPLLKLMTVVILNREEAALLTGCDYKDEKQIFRRLVSGIPGLVVMTDGQKGVLVSDGSNIYCAGVFREKRIADRTGAGDAFGSGFVSELVRSSGTISPAQIENAIRLGSANATSVVETIGAEAGILTRVGFSADSRWRKLKIARSKVSDH